MLSLELSVLTIGIAITGLLFQPSPLLSLHPSWVEPLFAQKTLVMEVTPLKRFFSDFDSMLVHNDGVAEGAKRSHMAAVKERSPQLPLSKHQQTIEVYRSMKVTFRQSGGYTGLIKGCEIDTDLLPSDEAIRLQSLVERSGILKAEGGQTPNARDLFDYEIIVEIGKDIYHVSFDSSATPKNVMPLLEYLKSRAKPRSL
jgi:hypothetical protein